MRRLVRLFLGLIGVMVAVSFAVSLGSAIAAIAARRRLVSSGDETSDDLDLVAIYDGTEMASVAQRFRRGRLLAWFGGAVLDLRGATLDPAGATIDARAAWGGVTLIVPEGWRVSMHSRAIFGGGGSLVNDDGLPADAPELDVRAFSIYGGVSVLPRRPDEMAEGSKAAGWAPLARHRSGAQHAASGEADVPAAEFAAGSPAEALAAAQGESIASAGVAAEPAALVDAPSPERPAADAGGGRARGRRRARARRGADDSRGGPSQAARQAAPAQGRDRFGRTARRRLRCPRGIEPERARRVTTVLLVRHGLTAMTGPVLAGWTPGVHLDDRGQAQAAAMGARLRPVTLAAVVTSPLERCLETAAALISGRDPAPSLQVDERLGEVRYGAWTGRKLGELTREPLWKVVQGHPSAAVFPEGEGLAEMAARAAAAVREWNGRLGRDAVYAVVSHADVIKALVADALGLHFDGYQRVLIDPCSLTVIQYGELRAFVTRVNDTGGEVESLAPRPAKARSGRSRRRGALTSAAEAPEPPAGAGPRTTAGSAEPSAGAREPSAGAPDGPGGAPGGAAR